MWYSDFVDIQTFMDTLNTKAKENPHEKDVCFLDNLFQNFIKNFPLDNIGNSELIDDSKNIQEELMSSFNPEQKILLEEWCGLDNQISFEIIKQAIFYGFYTNLLIGNIFNLP